MKKQFTLLGSMSLLAIAGCGGGSGGGATTTPTPIPPISGKIAFVSSGCFRSSCEDEGNRRFGAIINADGSNRSFFGGGFSLSLSPDGRKATYYESNDDHGSGNLVLRATDGSGSVIVPSSGLGLDSRPVWSADSRRFIYSSYEGEQVVSPSELYIINADQTGHTRIPNTSDVAQATWNSNGNVIAFNIFSDSETGIYRMNIDGSGRVRLPGTSRQDSSPSYSSDGRRIVFMSRRDGNPEIYVMNADGSNQKRLTDNAAEDLDPVFSPDGSRIAFSSNRDNANVDQIYIMNSDGSGQTKLTSESVSARSPSWSRGSVSASP